MPDIPLLSIRWQIDSVSTPPPGRRSVAELAAVVGDRFEVEKEFRATSPQRRGAEPLPPLDVTIPTEPGASYLLAVRQEGSGALSFHAPKTEPQRRGATSTGAPGTATFEIQFPEDVDEGTRRSILTKAIKGVVLKAAGKFADLAVPWVGSEVESFIWKKKGLLLGWLQVSKETLESGKLLEADFSAITSPTDRCLLLLHGTFSNAAGAFQALGTTRAASGRDFFSAVAPIYGNRIYAFNHFTVSQTPEENAADLLKKLPTQATFDVITHSRGGLVLRNLVERQAALGADAAKFQLRQAVLVAAPLGTWRRKVSDSGEPGGYIDGKEVASKLKDHVASLGVTRLICITVFALADDERKGLALWNEDQSQRVSIVSGDLIFAHIDDPRTSLNRFLANMLVSALCGLEEHKDGPPDCPNDCPDSFKASDPKVRAAALITKYKLCPVCAAKLGKQADSIGRILAAW